MEYAGKDAEGRPAETRIETLNLSGGGFYATANREIPELTRLGLRLVLPAFGRDDAQERTIDCQAVVVRCHSEDSPGGTYRLAACFVGLDSVQQRAIERYVAWHATVFAGEGPADPGGGVEEAAG